MAGFLQTPPALGDAWRDDRVLREALHFHLGDDAFAAAEPELAEMGALAVSPRVLGLARRAETEPPVHVPYSPWGRRVDEIRLSDAYVELGRIGVEAGVTALPYERSPLGERVRIAWAGLVALWGPSSALYTCPVAMTDGAARTLLQHGGPDDVAVVERLTSRDPGRAWTSGQWMTETAGGSDVGGTETIARVDERGRWRLTGTKWFTSSTTSEIALTLARPEGVAPGSRPLALFRVHRTLDDGSANGIVVRRLKDKLGTRALPTAELELDGALAHPVGDPRAGGGVRLIATMLNVTRIHNAIGSTAYLGRALAWARAYARVRRVGGRLLATMPAHRATLADLATDYAASMALVTRCCELMGAVEHGRADATDARVLRGLTPVTKLATARWGVAGVTEAMEAIGGVGYCEDSTIPAIVRNSHVNPIWEGTTNVLALDFLRAAQRDDALAALAHDCRDALARVRDDDAVAAPAALAAAALDELEARAARWDDDDRAQAGARSLALGLASTYACARLCLQGAWAARRGDVRTAAVATRLARRGLVPPEPPPDDGLGMDEPVSPQGASSARAVG
ncbi:MAG TPA: acyl-CoA dehydrogenase family protein [Actinomycetota bacterium]|nr:acyl-CoA dehydrogenase family protein [Actinomycetota bacterium]